MAERSRLLRDGVALLILAALAVGLFFALRPQSALGSDPRTFTVNNDGVTCPHTVTFQGKTLNLDGSTDWSYLVENKDGSGCGTSHWVLSLCQTTPSAYDAFVEANPNGVLTAKSGDPTTGVVGVKWNDIQNGDTDPPGAKFTLTLNQDFAIDNDVPIAIKVGTVTDGVIPGTIEGPDCAKLDGPTDTPTPTATATATSSMTPTATPTSPPLPPPLGGSGVFPDMGGTALKTAESPGVDTTVLAGMLAAATAGVGTLAGAVLYVRRRASR